tara:strand:- start:222 stop:596 length:375 start_codon:yes stop_codon:yes gene_type:complete
MTKMQQAWKILSSDQTRSEEKKSRTINYYADVGSVLVSSDIEREDKRRRANPSRFTREQVEAIILDMYVGESILLKNEAERNLFYLVTNSINYYMKPTKVAVSTQLVEVEGDELYNQIRLWRTA